MKVHLQIRCKREYGVTFQNFGTNPFDGLSQLADDLVDGQLVAVLANLLDDAFRSVCVVKEAERLRVSGALQTAQPGVRALALLAFRDEAACAGPAAPAPAPPRPAGGTASAAAARLLGPAHAHACLRVEALLARCVSPLLGARGLYEDFAPAPVVPAQPAPLRQHNRSGRKMLRPLSVAAGQRLHTLSDLFAAAVAAHVHGGHAHARLDA
ncbi:Protor-2 [Gryllus bimaculatus]|nr:Protor-2 [Gryllus bimaculatus]